MSGVALKSLFSGIADTTGWKDVAIGGLCIDSRKLVRDDLFLALPGFSTDGRNYIGAVLEAGAAAVVAQDPSGYRGDGPVYAVPDLGRLSGAIADRFFQHPSRRMCVVGITGTNGKTTCCHLLAQVLNEIGAKSAVLGTLGNGFIDQLENAELTTADVVSVHRSIRELADAGAEFLCMEASSHALDQGRVNRVAFDVAVFTNLSQDHLDYHPDMQAYGAAKSSLFQWPDLTACVVNIDDDFGVQLAASISPGLLWSYGSDPRAAVRLKHLEVLPDGLILQLSVNDQPLEMSVPLIGAFNAHNVLAVFATLCAMGFSATRIAAAMTRVRPVRGRMEVISADGGPRAVVDYAHTPDALAHALSACRAQCEGALWVVFGCGGDRDADKRPKMGGVACRMADHIVLTSDNPRNEDPQQIIADIARGCDGREHQIIDRPQAIRFALSQAAADDMVLVAGKGHEDYQLVQGRMLSMDDRRIAMEVLH